MTEAKKAAAEMATANGGAMEEKVTAKVVKEMVECCRWQKKRQELLPDR